MRRRTSYFTVGCAALLIACNASRDSTNEAPDARAPVAYGCAARADGAPAICDFASMAFRVTDLAKARAFYGDALGLAEPFSVSNTIAVYKINDTQLIELYEEAPAPNDTNFQLKKIAFSTSDAEALRQAFAAKGVSVPPAVSKNALGNTSFSVTDPDGHTIEWVHYEADSLTGQTLGRAMPDTRIGGSVHHLGVTIQDPAGSAIFYQTLLGFLPSSTADKQASEAPGSTVRIEYGVTHAAPTKDFAVVRDHLCLRVADTMQAVASLAARNPALRIEHHVLDGFTVRANVYDPDGTRIELADSVLLPNGEDAGPGDVGELDSGASD